MAYERYQQNLQKMNESKQKMDEYAEQMKGRQVDLYGKFRDMEGAKKLNEMNVRITFLINPQGSETQ